MPSSRGLRTRSALSPRQLVASAVALFAVLLVAAQTLIDIPVAYAKTAGPPIEGLVQLTPSTRAMTPWLAHASSSVPEALVPLQSAPRPVRPEWMPHIVVADLIDDLQDALDAAQDEFDYAKGKFDKKKASYKKKKTDKKKKAKNKWKQKKKDAKALLELAQQAFDDAVEQAAATAELSVPMLVQEALPAGEVGIARDDAVVTFGLPFSNLQQVLDVDGRPSLSVIGSNRWQARTLATWPDGSVKWALLDALVDVPESVPTESLVVTLGEGVSGGANIASQSGSTIALDTGVLQATVEAVNFNVLDRVTVDGVTIVPKGTSSGITGLTTA